MRSRLLRADGAPPRLWGHRGTRRGAPENTLRAFQLAIDQGADGVELDVRRCATGEVVVIHDADLTRLAGVPARVADLSLAELAACDVGEGESVPRLDEACALVLGAGACLNIEIKSDGEDLLALVASVATVVMGLPEEARERVLISSFEPRALALVSRAVTPCPLALLFSKLPPPDVACDAVHPHFGCASNAAIAGWRAAGKLVNVWTVNEVDEASRLEAAGVDGLITDDIPAIRGF